MMNRILLLVTAILSSYLASSTTLEEAEDAAFAAAAWRHDIVLENQEKLLHPEGNHADFERHIESALGDTVKDLKKQFQETPRPADRMDNPENKIFHSAPVWFLMEIPQWWVTAMVVDVIDEKRAVVRQTATGEELEVTRGKEMRVVAPQDQNVWNSEYLRDKGELARVQGKQDERKKMYQEAIKVDPTNPHPMDNLGLYLMEHGIVKQSRYWLEQAIKVNPKWYHAYYNLGLLVRDNPDLDFPEDALQLFEKAFQLNPLFLDSLWNIAELHSKLGNYQEECYHWRMLQLLNRNPSPDERDFGTWNPEWEDFTTQRIEQCMVNLRKQHGYDETTHRRQPVHDEHGNEVEHDEL